MDITIESIKNSLDQAKNEEVFTISEEAIELVNDLFELFAIHISAFNYFASDNERLSIAKQEWVRCFQEEKIEKNHVTIGVNKIRKSNYKFMISPTEFILLCRPIKPQSDTVDRDWMFVKGIESDEHKKKKREIALNFLDQMKKKLG